MSMLNEALCFKLFNKATALILSLKHRNCGILVGCIYHSDSVLPCARDTNNINILKIPRNKQIGLAEAEIHDVSTIEGHRKPSQSRPRSIDSPCPWLASDAISVHY